MPCQPLSLTAHLKHLGFARGNQMRLYGEKFEVAGDPIVITEELVLVEAMDVKSRTVKRVRIPLPILKMAQERAA